MYARSTTINGDPGAIDAGIAYVRDEVMPMIQTMDGCLGISFVVDRETGRCIATTSWETEEAMRVSRDKVAANRARAAELMGGTPEVDEWEVAVMHRDHNTTMGAGVRITWTRPRDMDATIDFWRSNVLPRVESMAGFCSANLLIDRPGNRTCGTVSFDSRAALEATREGAAAMRENAAREVGVEFLDVAEFDLALAHLRLPEVV